MYHSALRMILKLKPISSFEFTQKYIDQVKTTRFGYTFSNFMKAMCLVQCVAVECDRLTRILHRNTFAYLGSKRLVDGISNSSKEMRRIQGYC